MTEELIRAACESANCKYPDMEAMANFKREVTPSVVIGLIDGLRHAKGMAAINDARANGAAETIQHLRDDIAELRAKLPNQGGEAVEVVGYGCEGQIEVLKHVPLTGGMKVSGREREKYNVPLMTVAQHNRIMADVRSNRDAVLKVMRARKMLPKCEPSPDAELVELLRSKFPRIDPCKPVPLDEKAHCCEYTIYVERERLHAVLDALSASGKGVKL